MALHPHERQVTDILVKAEWLENVVTQGAEPVLMFADDGKHKLWLFSRLHRELIAGGLQTPEQLAMLLEMGMKLGEQEKWEVAQGH